MLSSRDELGGYVAGADVLGERGGYLQREIRRKRWHPRSLTRYLGPRSELMSGRVPPPAAIYGPL